MNYEYENGIVTFPAGIYDPHAHPRVFDPFTDEAVLEGNTREGKAGLAAYTAVALNSGITVMSAMPNEFRRHIDPENPDATMIMQYPISTLDKAQAMEARLATESYMRMTYHLGVAKAEVLDEETGALKVDAVRSRFMFAGVNSSGLKVFGDESTGGQNIPVEHIPTIAKIWNGYYPEKPVILHLEDGNVRMVLEDIFELENGSDIPIHIAHVSSREELEAIIEAKQRGMDVTCEATPHHLFVSQDQVGEIGGYGCMKPSLKSQEDVAFLWENLHYIDMFASDCAPHQQSDKEAESPAYGVTNHTAMMPLLFGAHAEGRLGLANIFEKTVVNPRRRFNLPMDDGSSARFNLNASFNSAEQAEAMMGGKYDANIFAKLEEVGRSFTLRGVLVEAVSGASRVHMERGVLQPELRTSLRHLVTVQEAA